MFNEGFYSPNETPNQRSYNQDGRFSTLLICMNSCTIDCGRTPAPKDATKLMVLFHFFSCFSFDISMINSWQRGSSGLQDRSCVKSGKWRWEAIDLSMLPLKAIFFNNSSKVSRAEFFPFMFPETPSAQAKHLTFLKVTPARASVARNSRATFDCEVINGHGKAEPIAWSPVPKEAFQEKDTLIIDPVRPEHNGTFTCRSGNMTRHAVLNVGE